MRCSPIDMLCRLIRTTCPTPPRKILRAIAAVQLDDIAVCAPGLDRKVRRDCLGKCLGVADTEDAADRQALDCGIRDFQAHMGVSIQMLYGSAQRFFAKDDFALAPRRGGGKVRMPVQFLLSAAGARSASRV